MCARARVLDRITLELGICFLRGCRLCSPMLYGSLDLMLRGCLMHIGLPVLDKCGPKVATFRLWLCRLCFFFAFSVSHCKSDERLACICAPHIEATGI